LDDKPVGLPGRVVAAVAHSLVIRNPGSFRVDLAEFFIRETSIDFDEESVWGLQAELVLPVRSCFGPCIRCTCESKAWKTSSAQSCVPSAIPTQPPC
jgi:hypothetical protein